MVSNICFNGFLEENYTSWTWQTSDCEKKTVIILFAVWVTQVQCYPFFCLLHETHYYEAHLLAVGWLERLLRLALSGERGRGGDSARCRGWCWILGLGGATPSSQTFSEASLFLKSVHSLCWETQTDRKTMKSFIYYFLSINWSNNDIRYTNPPSNSNINTYFPYLPVGEIYWLSGYQGRHLIGYKWDRCVPLNPVRQSEYLSKR